MKFLCCMLHVESDGGSQDRCLCARCQEPLSEPGLTHWCPAFCPVRQREVGRCQERSEGERAAHTALTLGVSLEVAPRHSRLV